MASDSGNGNGNGLPPPGPNQKTLNVWSKPIDETKIGDDERPTISNAVAMIKPDDFKNVASTPCARNALLTGIAGGFGLGGVRFVFSGKIGKAANWAVGTFVFASMGQYEYCQYLRRCEKRDMKRNIEVINESKREKAKKLVEEKKEKVKAEQEKLKESSKSWWPSKWW
ncbi:unnamed protein product [Clonostachys rhizophaga]|uniref:Cytochrome c oxidase assembly protein COX20, mitochondrial n=1 Tax=Clonostachys rhizophaga TaxID=160324 RepID=A0A9N9VHD4_9HYPO|nr:unnamed protein product [Clonostachys rhizophaga]